MTGALADGLVGGALVRGWFKCVFNAATFTLAGLAAWGVASTVSYQSKPVLAPLAGIAAGAAAWTVNHVLVAVVIRLASDGQVRFHASMRSSLTVLPYELAYGWAAAGVALLHHSAGAAGFTMLLAPVVAGQTFLVLLARRSQRHHAELRDAEEAERRRIARDLHDTVVQVVAGSAMILAAQSELPGRTPAAKDLIGRTAEDLRGAAQDLRTLIVQIAPPTLEQDGLRIALQALLRPLSDRGIEVTLDCPSRGPSAGVDELVYRVAQEALRNVVAHAGATQVTIAVKVEPEATALSVIDNGRGFTPADVERRRNEGHVGTRGLAEVAAQGGATLSIDSGPGQGTRLVLRIPTRSV